MPGKRHPIERKALAIAATSAGGFQEGSKISGVPVTTIRGWVHDLGLMDDSELEAFIVEKKRIMSGMWAHLGIEAQEFAQELRLEGNAKGFQAAILAAGIASTKLESLGQPKDITPASPATPTLLREIPGLPTDKEPQEG